MGLHDREYMKDADRVSVGKTRPQGGPTRRDTVDDYRNVSWWRRIQFKLWLWFHKRGEED